MSKTVKATPAAAGHGLRVSDQLGGSIDPKYAQLASQKQEVPASAPRTKAQKLAEQLLRDRERRTAAKAPEKAKPRTKVFEPLKECPAGPWHVTAGGDPGYMPRTPMRMGPVGWFIQCVGCGTEFESIGLAHCGKSECRAAAPRRKSTTEGYAPPPPRAGARLCECGCGRSIPVWRKTKTKDGKITTRRVSKATRFFSGGCQARAARRQLLRGDDLRGKHPRGVHADLHGETLQKGPENGPSREALIGPADFPISLIGGYRHPEAPALDPELRRAVLRVEARLLPDEAPAVPIGASDAVPIGAGTRLAFKASGPWSDVPDIPDCLKRGAP
jgi:hypothetical protein